MVFRMKQFIKKIGTFYRLFPYKPVALNPQLMVLYKMSIEKASFKYKFLFTVSDIYTKVFPKKESEYLSVFDYEINALNKKRDAFIPQNYLSHLFGSGSTHHIEIVNNKVKFHKFCLEYALPIPELMGFIKLGKIQLTQTDIPWGKEADFLVKPAFGSKSAGIYDFRFKGNNTYQILDENRAIDRRFIPQFLEHYAKKGSYVIQQRIPAPSEFCDAGISHVPILRVLSKKVNAGIEIINPVLIINKEKQYLNARLANKDFYAIDTQTGKIIGGIVFDHTPNSLTIVQLPNWQMLIQIIQKAHEQVFTLNLIGWDVALSEKGYLLIEANKSPWLEVHQKFPFANQLFLEKILNLC